MIPQLRQRLARRFPSLSGRTIHADESHAGRRECASAKRMNDSCPACGSTWIVTGRYLDQLAGGLLPVFRPTGLKPFTLTGSDVRIPAADRFCCCAECGHLWSGLKPEQLLSVLRRYGNRRTRERFDEEFPGDN